MALGDGADGVHVGALAVEVDGNDGLRVRADGGFDGLVEVEGFLDGAREVVGVLAFVDAGAFDH